MAPIGPSAATLAVAAYPNPLRDGQVQLTYTLPQAGPVSLRLVDAITGRTRLTLLDNDPQTAGEQRLSFDASRLPQGVYIYQLVTDRVTTGRLVKRRIANALV